MNERTHFFIRIYLSHFILDRVDVGCVWEVRWRRGQTATYWPKVLLTIAALVPHFGWGCSTVGHWGPKAPCLPLALTRASCPQLQLELTKPSVAPGYIIVSRSPASAVPPFIYTGASLDWWLGRGSIYNNVSVGGSIFFVGKSNWFWSTFGLTVSKRNILQPSWISIEVILNYSLRCDVNILYNQ